MLQLKQSRQDIYIYLLLLVFGGWQLVFSCRAADFAYDTYYYELAQSILAKVGYGFNSRPEPMIPPGFPALLALLIVAVGNSYAVLIRSMAFFTTFGLIATYQVFKSEEGRRIAGVVCLLLASSPRVFQFSTTMLFSDMPYFFTSMLLLWAVSRLDSTVTRTGARALWWTLSVLLLLASILLRSTGIALAGGVVGWLVVSLFREREVGRRRIAMFLPLVVVGLVAQMAWMLWAEQHPVSQWTVHGYEESYVAQLKLKNGNNPELGMATWRDVLQRPLENEDDMAASMVGLFTHKEMAPAWYSPGTVIPLALLLIGLTWSFSMTGGGIIEWYFVCYQFLFLFWPWNFELRFQLPVAPLAVLFMWRGGRLLGRWVRNMPRETGTVCFAVAVLGILSSVVWGWRIRHPSVQACIGLWLLGACLSAVILAGGSGMVRKQSLLLKSAVSLRGVSRSSTEIAVGVSLICMLVSGLWMQTVLGLENLHRTPEMDPNIEAAEWIRGHSAADAVVMARWEARVYHYSRHKVIWFPASSDPELLMAGIRRHHIRLIVVVEDDDIESYWKPSDGNSFKVLIRAYPTLFRKVHQGAREQVYECAESAWLRS